MSELKIKNHQDIAADKVLTLTDERFLAYMRERHYPTEEAVLANISGHSIEKALIRAVAEWRIAKRGSAT